MVFQQRTYEFLHVCCFLVWVDVDELLSQEGLDFFTFHIGAKKQQLIRRK